MSQNLTALSPLDGRYAGKTEASSKPEPTPLKAKR